MSRSSSTAPQDTAAARTASVIAGIAGLGAAVGFCALVSRGRLTEILTVMDFWENIRSPVKFALAIWVGAYYDLIFIAALTLSFAGLAYAAHRHPRLQRLIGGV